MTRTLDGVLDGFLEDAGAVTRSISFGKSKPKSKSVRTEGAWIGCKGGSAFVEREVERPPPVEPDVVDVGEGRATEDEEDEEIWWVWDGKIVGFADW